ncbi:hypothetical protein H072_7909 [Dactylellina haptotyla CBS 200.50]|uniref:Nucleoside transporter n=1 Tax=Dactylellina haptotyla (strain CBS 200.50) TaxID=1284197 RepID=S8BGC8_DACHA|nr:hypothetical protein H072_7909 [Dactylellina haptotyla CBS 200.50]
MPVEYTPLDGEAGDLDVDDVDAAYDPPSMTSSTVLLSPRATKTFGGRPISYFDYVVFLMLGVAMLWAWNCFLAAAAYFQMRFKDSQAILNTFQSSIMTVSTSATLITTLTLSHLNRTAHYPYRITCALVINIVVFTLLALSTTLFTDISAGVYLAFTLLMVLGTAISAGFFQNGLFSYVGSFGPIYSQAVMSGQGVAGVLPSIAQMISVLAIPPKSPESQDDKTASASPKSAFAYFLTATAVSAAALLLFRILLSRHSDKGHSNHPVADELAGPDALQPKKNLSLWQLLKKLPLPAYTVFFTFALTMIFPVFTQATFSVSPPSSSVFSRPEVFIPFSFFIWNSGDLIGRVVCGFPKLACTNPTILAIASTARIVYLPIYFLCNIKGGGAKVNSDFFYELVQFTFGLTNGYVGSNTMMLAPGLVSEDEIPAAGGFMGLCLVAGLAAGSAASFLLNI